MNVGAKPAEANACRFVLRLIGPFELADSAGRTISITSRRSIALIAMLAMSPRGVRMRTWLQAMLWEGRGASHAQGSLRRELSTLSATLRAAGAEHLIQRDSTRVSLALDALDIDVMALGSKVERGEAAPRDEFLEGIDLPESEGFEDWLRAERARCRELQAYRHPEQTATPGVLQILGSELPPTRDLVSAEQGRSRAIPPKPSIAVLPFRCVSDSPGDDQLGLGIAEEIEFSLTTYRSLFVVSTISANVLLQRNLISIEIARQLGVRYLIEGAIRRVGDRIRINVVLIDGSNGEQVWSHRCEVGIDSLFTLHDEIAQQVAPRIHTRVDQIELQLGISRTPRTGDAYALYWRANALTRNWDKTSILESIELAEQLVALEPTAAWASSIAGFSYACAYSMGWLEQPEAGRQAATFHFQNALRHGAGDPMTLGYAAGTLGLLGGDVEVADRLIGQALNLLPNYQPTLFWGGWIDLVRGNAERAQERLELSLRINPEAGVRAYAIAGIGIALLMRGKPAEAFDLLADAILHIPRYPFALAAHSIAAALTARNEEAARSARLLAESDGAAQLLSLMRDPAQHAMLEAALHQIAASGT